ncbi:hypothetical protein BD408DRAFT_426528 [Parasitella parasitica]|nr:hypothetical protein BD408DRAFT_426528 [Parasitella parasitica]
MYARMIMSKLTLKELNSIYHIKRQDLRKFELYSIYLADLMEEYAVPRECHCQIVRLMNTMIRDYNTL